jgi:hypothetical protein
MARRCSGSMTDADTFSVNACLVNEGCTVRRCRRVYILDNLDNNSCREWPFAPSHLALSRRSLGDWHIKRPARVCSIFSWHSGASSVRNTPSARALACCSSSSRYFCCFSQNFILFLSAVDDSTRPLPFLWTSPANTAPSSSASARAQLPSRTACLKAATVGLSNSIPLSLLTVSAASWYPRSDRAWMSNRVISPLSWPMYVEGSGCRAGAFPLCEDPFSPSLPFLIAPLEGARRYPLVPLETSREVPLDGPGPLLLPASMFVRRRLLAGRRESVSPGVEGSEEPSSSGLDCPCLSSSS